MRRQLLPHNRCSLALGLLVLTATFIPALAADEGGTPVPATQATIERIMEQAVRNITRRYNLNEEQSQKTDELMRREVTRFLTEHEKEVWPVIRDLLATQLSGKPPENLDEVKRLGDATLPLFKLAKETILSANEEWGHYLTEEQKHMHDYDLAEMNKTFAAMEENFTSWAQGRVVDAPIFPPPQGADKSPPQPRMPHKGLPEPVVDIHINMTVFDAIVDEFLKEYDTLGQGQIDSARSILKEYKAKANDFLNAKKAELKKTAIKQRTAMSSRNHELLAEAVATRKQLLQPFHALVEQMQTRLNGLLTTAQIQRHAQRSKERPKPDGKDAKAAKRPAGKDKTPVAAQTTASPQRTDEQPEKEKSKDDSG